LGFTKSRLIVRWFDPVTKSVKHASAVRFDELNTKLYSTDTLAPGALILSGMTPPSLTSDTCVDIINHPHLENHPLPFHHNYLVKVLVWDASSAMMSTIIFHTSLHLPLVHHWLPNFFNMVNTILLFGF